MAAAAEATFVVSCHPCQMNVTEIIVNLRIPYLQMSGSALMDRVPVEKSQ